MVEQIPLKDKVEGSSPSGRIKKLDNINLEGWQSGLMRWFRKPVGEKSPHRFKSCTLRLRFAEARESEGELRQSYGVTKSALATTKL